MLPHRVLASTGTQVPHALYHMISSSNKNPICLLDPNTPRVADRAIIILSPIYHIRDHHNIEDLASSQGLFKVSSLYAVYATLCVGLLPFPQRILPILRGLETAASDDLQEALVYDSPEIAIICHLLDEIR